MKFGLSVLLAGSILVGVTFSDTGVVAAKDATKHGAKEKKHHPKKKSKSEKSSTTDGATAETTSNATSVTKSDRTSVTTTEIAPPAAKSTSGSNKPPTPAAELEAAKEQPETEKPILVSPSTLVDLTTAKFGRLDIQLKDASFLDAQVAELRLTADNMDMTKGTLEGLSVQVDKGKFQDFTLDSLRLWAKDPMTFDTNALLNGRVLQFREPAIARARVSVSQDSLNSFLNAPFILERLSGSAKKRVPILSAMARRDVKFGFNFLRAAVNLQENNSVRLSMDSKLGMGNLGIPVKLTAEGKMHLKDGWVNFEDTRLVTGGQTVPKDMAEKIITRINSLSKWGTQSDDIQFEFTDLDVIPEDRVELEGSAKITRLRFARSQEDKITPASDNQKSAE